jgi:hypothetical protein
MKITKSKLKQVIKEEIKQILQEQATGNAEYTVLANGPEGAFVTMKKENDSEVSFNVRGIRDGNHFSFTIPREAIQKKVTDDIENGGFSGEFIGQTFDLTSEYIEENVLNPISEQLIKEIKFGSSDLAKGNWWWLDPKYSGEMEHKDGLTLLKDEILFALLKFRMFPDAVAILYLKRGDSDFQKAVKPYEGALEPDNWWDEMLYRNQQASER